MSPFRSVLRDGPLPSDAAGVIMQAPILKELP